MNRTKLNWIIDTGLFLVFVLAFWLDLTGLSFHQWLGAAIAAVVAVHLILHWKWVSTVTSRFFQRTSWQARSYYVVDLFLFLGLGLISFTGLAISTWLDMPLANYDGWRTLHVYVSILTLAALVLKIGLHWRWIVNTTKKYFSMQLPKPSAQAELARYRTAAGQQSANHKNDAGVSRKEFLRLMGVVGSAAFISAFGVLNEEISTAQASSSGVTAVNGDQTTAETVFSQQFSSSSSGRPQSNSDCGAQCPRGCSYPGHCRRYTDTNQNGLCDLGECA